jgi:hypothetical protein
MLPAETSEAAMGDFRTFQKARREPASPLKPIVDPAGWSPQDLADPESYSYRFTDADRAEIKAAIAAARRKGASLVDIRPADFPLNSLAKTLADVRRELLDGRGLVLLRGFPVGELSREEIAIGYLGLGSHLGERFPQNAQGHLLGHVKDLGGSNKDPSTRGYMTREEMWFHTDSTDFVGLLCLQTAKSGGQSRVASSVTLYNRMLAERPDLADALNFDFYYTRHGENNPGEDPWYRQPVFAFTDGYFSACGYSQYIQKAQGLPGVPPLTAAQMEAIPYYRKLAEDCALDMDFRVGDIQFLNNHVMVHSRRDYEDWPEWSRKRHLLRLWLNDAVGRPIPEYRRQGRHGRGVRLDNVKLVAPLDVEVPA